MREIFALPWTRLLAIWIVGTPLVLGLAALLFAWSGLYNVAASEGHLAPTRWFLDFGMRQSVKTQSLGIRVPNLQDDNLVSLGAGHFQGGCAPCHGAPGLRANPIVQRMLPEPPSLKKRVRTWQDRQLFWIVKHGIKYAGMPAWTTQKRDDEVWAVVAFLRHLPEMSPEHYRRLAFGNTRARNPSGAQLVNDGPSSAALAACARCHGDADHGPTSKLVPRLAGQTRAYLVEALQAYAHGKRQSGIMEPVAAELTASQIDTLATFYSNLDRQAEVGEPSDETGISNGRLLATQGLAAEAIPPCQSCHDGAASDLFPRLAGQSSAYIVSQLRLWKKGRRAGTPRGAIMAPIARRLTEQQARAVAEYYSALPPTSPASVQSPDRRSNGSSR